MATRSGDRWEDWEDGDVPRLFNNGRSLAYIADYVGRTEKAVFLRLRDVHNLIPKYLTLSDFLETKQEPLLDTMTVTEDINMKDRTVKQVTFIGDKKADQYSIEDLLTIIEEQEAFIERLEKLNSTPAIHNLINKHKDNVSSLTNLIGELA